MSSAAVLQAPPSHETGIPSVHTVSGIATVLESWLDERRTVGRGIARHTEQAYRRDLTTWATRIADAAGKPPSDEPLARVDLQDLDAQNVKRALAGLAREEYSAASRKRMLTSLRGFCRWLVIEGLLVSDPTLQLGNPAIPAGAPVAFLRSELAAIVRTASEEDSDARFPWPSRDRALVAVLAGAGLRAAEVCGLTVLDVMREERPTILRVTGKGSKKRHVPVAAEVTRTIDEYLRERRIRIGPFEDTDALFLRYNGRPLTLGTLNYLVCRWVKRAGVHKPEGAAAHAFRHTYAKGLVTSGVPLSAVQALLGHASLNTTQVYLRMTGIELRHASEAAEVRDYLRETQGAST